MSDATDNGAAGRTEIVCVVDKSGSMGSIRDDAIGGFNTFLEDQQAEDGEASLTLTLFDTEYRQLYEGADLAEVEPLDHSTYQPGGGTALLDALGRTMDSVRHRIDDLDEDERPEQVIFLILTDGQENSSREYLGDQVPNMVQACRDERGWEFVFLAANIDAFAAAKSYNIDPGRVSQFAASGDGIQEAYRTMGTAVSSIRRQGQVTDDWRDAPNTDSHSDDDDDS